MVVGLQMRQRIPLLLFRNKRPTTNDNRSRVVPIKKNYLKFFKLVVPVISVILQKGVLVRKAYRSLQKRMLVL